MNRAREWIHCNEAYRRGLTGKGVGVAILDTGVFLHPDLENCVYGFRDFLKKKQQPYDDNGHGTHVAGMIAGSGTASAGRYQGVAPGAQLVCLKVLDQRGMGMYRMCWQGFAGCARMAASTGSGLSIYRLAPLHRRE